MANIHNFVGIILQACLEKDNKNNIYGYLISIYKMKGTQNY